MRSEDAVDRRRTQAASYVQCVIPVRAAIRTLLTREVEATIIHNQ